MNDEMRVPSPPALYVDALGYTWQPGLPEGAISMARTTERNLPSPDLLEYRPLTRDDRLLAIQALVHLSQAQGWPEAARDAAAQLAIRLSEPAALRSNP